MTKMRISNKLLTYLIISILPPLAYIVIPTSLIAISWFILMDIPETRDIISKHKYASIILYILGISISVLYFKYIKTSDVNKWDEIFSGKNSDGEEADFVHIRVTDYQGNIYSGMLSDYKISNNILKYIKLKRPIKNYENCLDEYSSIDSMYLFHSDIKDIQAVYYQLLSDNEKDKRENIVYSQDKENERKTTGVSGRFTRVTAPENRITTTSTSRPSKNTDL